MPYISCNKSHSNIPPTYIDTFIKPSLISCSYFLYTFSWANAHPLGANYAVMCNFHGSSSSNPSPNAFFRATGTSTSITVWVRTETGIIKDENFYVYTVP